MVSVLFPMDTGRLGYYNPRKFVPIFEIKIEKYDCLFDNDDASSNFKTSSDIEKVVIDHLSMKSFVDTLQNKKDDYKFPENFIFQRNMNTFLINLFI
jgi:hypothetical protein